jgi:hypothetical protein
MHETNMIIKHNFIYTCTTATENTHAKFTNNQEDASLLTEWVTCDRSGRRYKERSSENVTHKKPRRNLISLELHGKYASIMLRSAMHKPINVDF